MEPQRPTGYDHAEEQLSITTLADMMLAIHADCSAWSADGRAPTHVNDFLQRYAAHVTRLRSEQHKIYQYRELAELAVGDFGKVRLMQSPGGVPVAVKTLSKSYMLRRLGQACFMAERDVLVLGRGCWWIPELKAAFHDTDHLHLAMAFAPGGDLFGLLARQDSATICESEARFYIAELICALDELHTLGYVHRDVKPGNILVSQTGHIQLTDFGSCARVDKQGRVASRVTVGTPDYIAPEVLRAQEGSDAGPPAYGVECDWWAVGVVLYECLYGEPPFTAETLPEIYHRIMHHERYLKFPTDGPNQVSSHAVDLMMRLLCSAEQRLGRHGVEEIKKHPFFADTDWASLLHQQPPFIPAVNDGQDVRYFDDSLDDDDEPLPDPTRQAPSFSTQLRPTGFTGSQLPFVGYTFVPKDVPIPRCSQSASSNAALDTIRTHAIETELRCTAITAGYTEQPMPRGDAPCEHPSREEATHSDERCSEQQCSMDSNAMRAQQEEHTKDLQEIVGLLRDWIDEARALGIEVASGEQRALQRIRDLQRSHFQLQTQVRCAAAERDAATEAAAKATRQQTAPEMEDQAMTTNLPSARDNKQSSVHGLDQPVARSSDRQATIDNVDGQQNNLRDAYDAIVRDHARLATRVEWLERIIQKHVDQADHAEGIRLLQTLSEMQHQESVHDPEAGVESDDPARPLLETLQQSVEHSAPHKVQAEMPVESLELPRKRPGIHLRKQRPMSLRLTWVHDGSDIPSLYGSIARRNNQLDGAVSTHRLDPTILLASATDSTATEAELHGRHAWVRSKSRPVAAVQSDRTIKWTLLSPTHLPSVSTTSGSAMASLQLVGAKGRQSATAQMDQQTTDTAAAGAPSTDASTTDATTTTMVETLVDTTDRSEATPTDWGCRVS